MTKDGDTRVFMKSSSNQKITVYVSKRDFADYLTHIDPVEGVVMVSPEYQKDRKVFAHVMAAFQYGREDLDVMGLQCQKELFMSSMQVYPPLKEQAKPLSRFQDQLIKKLGPNAYPFFFELPPNAPSSVLLQPAPGEAAKQCGVDYGLKVYVANAAGEKAETGTSVRLPIRKLTYASEEEAPQPKVEKVKDFFMSPGTIRLEASLAKAKFYQGEAIAINVQIENKSNRTIKKIRLTVLQEINLVLHDNTSAIIEVCETEVTEGCPIQPNQSGFSKVFSITPSLSHSRDKQGLALDGDVRDDDTTLASSTIMTKDSIKEKMGIIVAYRVKVKLILGFGTRDLAAELPFTLTHAKPAKTASTDKSGDKGFNFEDFTRQPAVNTAED